MKKIITISTSLTIIVLLSSYLPKDKGIYELPKIIRNNYAFIPAGKVFIGRDSAEVSSFYILKTEIDNATYREFINDLKKNGRLQELTVANVDSEKWKSNLVYSEPYAKYYHSFPAYDLYPVVNISYEGAMLYCKWITEKLNKMYSHNFTYEVRLPSRIEWLRAAQLDKQNFVYAWGGPYFRNNRGMALCNYRQVGDECIYLDSATHKYAIENTYLMTVDMLSPVNSFYPNMAGIYNMNGNAAEMVSEKGVAVGGSWNSAGYDVRNQSVMNYTEPSPFVGFRPVLIIKELHKLPPVY